MGGILDPCFKTGKFFDLRKKRNFQEMNLNEKSDYPVNDLKNI